MKLFLLICFLPFSLTSMSCSCDTIPFTEAVEWADEIFIGKIVKAEKVQTGFSQRWRYTFEVSKKWKGNRATQVTLYEQGHTCDLGFQLWPDEYLIYASRNPAFKAASVSGSGSYDGENRLHTWLCSRTTFANYGEGSWFESDARKLDKLFPEFTAHHRKDPFHLLAFIAIAVWIILTFLVLFIVRKATRRRSYRQISNAHK